MRTSFSFGLLFLLFVWLPLATEAQVDASRNDLEKKRSQLNTQIQKTNKQLRETENSRKSTSKQLSALQKKMRGREQSIQSIAEEMELLDANIHRKQQIVVALKDDLLQLKQGYHQVLRLLYRYKIQQKPVLFFLSAAHFTEMQKRRQFLQQLENRQYQQMRLIVATRHSLDKNLAFLQAQKDKKNGLLTGELKEKNALGQEIKSKDKAVQSLKQKEQRLRSDLAQKEKSRQQLNSKIESVIRGVIANQKQDALSYSNATAGTGKSGSTATAPLPKMDDKSIHTSFAARKGRLPHPTAGTLVSGFGRQMHPQFPEVFTHNNGIDIQTKANAAVQAVHEGVVVSVFTVPGNGNAVMIKHGDFYTTYSNLSSVLVKRGAKLRAKDKIGAVGKDQTSGKYVLHFELWRGKTKENPAAWLGI